MTMAATVLEPVNRVVLYVPTSKIIEETYLPLLQVSSLQLCKMIIDGLANLAAIGYNGCYILG